MIRRFTDFLGPARVQALFVLLAATGLVSLVLNAMQGDWVRPVQSLLVLVFAIGFLIIVNGRLDAAERGRWLGILLPAIGALVLGLTVLPQFLLPLFGGAVGWIVAGVLLFRTRVRMEYRDAVKHLRKNEYAEAVKLMDGVVKEEPEELQHYRFRAEILRLWGKLDRAKRDYAQMVKIDPASAVGYNGLAEVNLQAGDYAEALDAALKAYELAPDEWVAAYNLGMIEDRLAHSEAAVGYLNHALERKIPDARHRLLIRLYLARAYARLGQLEAAQEEIAAISLHRGGLSEWQTLLSSDQAETLRAVLAEDVAAAGALIDGTLDAADLARTT
jgi:tetratricopeptide (TPR) repeat protein